MSPSLQTLLHEHVTIFCDGRAGQRPLILPGCHCQGFYANGVIASWYYCFSLIFLTYWKDLLCRDDCLCFCTNYLSVLLSQFMKMSFPSESFIYSAFCGLFHCRSYCPLNVLHFSGYYCVLAWLSFNNSSRLLNLLCSWSCGLHDSINIFFTFKTTL